MENADVTDERSLPPIGEMGIAALILVVAAGIYLTAQTNSRPNLVPAVIALTLAGVVVAVAVVMLARVGEFAWGKFRMVFGWALLEYAVIAGMLVYVFILDQVPSATLTVLIAALALFAVDIPMMFGFAVARYQSVSPKESRNEP
jgi:hypothetical protein